MATVLLLLVIVVHLAKGSVVNVALGKPVYSSVVKPGYSAGSAVDGKTDTGGYTQLNILNTGTGYDFAWWKVDLQREVQNASVRIYFRTDYTWRRNGVELYTSTSPFPDSNSTSQGQLCHTVTGDPSGSDIPDVNNVTCPGRWRYLLLYTDTDNLDNGYSTGPTLDFGEVMVFGCSDDTYGADCTAKCGYCRDVCDSGNGSCPAGCLYGYNGTKCDWRLIRAHSIRWRSQADVPNVILDILVGMFFVVTLLAAGIQICVYR